MSEQIYQHRTMTNESKTSLARTHAQLHSPDGLRIQLRARSLILLLGTACVAGFGEPTAGWGAAAGTLDAVYDFSATDFMVDPFQPYVYANSGASLKVINSGTLAVERSVVLPNASSGMAMSPDGNKLYIAGGTSQSILVLDSHTWNLLPSLAVSDNPRGLAMGLNNRLFVLGNHLSQIDADSGASTGPDASVFAYSGALRISPDRKTLYYADFGLSPATLYKFDVSSTTPTLLWRNGSDIGENGEQLALSHDGSMIAYVCGFGYQGYQIPNFRTADMLVLGVFPTGPYPNCLAYSPDDKYAYALHTVYPTAVDIFDVSSRAMLGQFPVVDRARVMTTDQTGQHLFIAFDGVYFGHTEVRVYDTGLNATGNQSPVARCRDLTRPADSNCQATAGPTDFDNGSYDPDGDPITFALSPAGPYSLGTNLVTFTVTDSHGASNSCTALLIVQASTPPLLTCPPNTTIDPTSPHGAAVSFAATASTLCGGSTEVVCVPPSSSTFPIGATTVVCTATDPAGNTADCHFQVTVLSPRDMLSRLIALVRAQAKRPQPLLASLEAARAALERGNAAAAVNQLQAFQNKVRAQIAPFDLGFSHMFFQAAQNIINALEAKPSQPWERAWERIGELR